MALISPMPSVPEQYAASRKISDNTKNSNQEVQLVEIDTRLVINITGKSTFTLPSSTLYTAGDLIANSGTAGSVSSGSVTGARLESSGNASGKIRGVAIQFSANQARHTVRVHLFAAVPTMTLGDNAAFSITSLDLDNFLGYVDVFVSTVNGAGSLGFTACELNYKLTISDTLFYRLEAVDGFTPSSGETVSVKLMLDRFS